MFEVKLSIQHQNFSPPPSAFHHAVVSLLHWWWFPSRFPREAKSAGFSKDCVIIPVRCVRSISILQATARQYRSHTDLCIQVSRAGVVLRSLLGSFLSFGYYRWLHTVDSRCTRLPWEPDTSVLFDLLYCCTEHPARISTSKYSKNLSIADLELLQNREDSVLLIATYYFIL
jgi:hypothetical protein